MVESNRTPDLPSLQADNPYECLDTVSIGARSVYCKVVYSSSVSLDWNVMATVATTAEIASLPGLPASF